MSIACTDAMGERIELARPPYASRCLLLVPSETETLFALGAGAVVVGRTEYCVEPAGLVETVAVVGGTKNARIDAIMARSPRISCIGKPRGNTPGDRALTSCAGCLGPYELSQDRRRRRDRSCSTSRGSSASIRRQALQPCSSRCAATSSQPRSSGAACLQPVRVFCPIWMDPLMTIHGETFISDVIDLARWGQHLCRPNAPVPRSRRILRASRAVVAGLEVAGRDVCAIRASPSKRSSHSRTGRRTCCPTNRIRSPKPTLLSSARSTFPAAPKITGASCFSTARTCCWYSPRMGTGIARVRDAIRGAAATPAAATAPA